MIRLLMIVIILGALCLIVYLFASKSQKLKDIVEPDGPSVLDQAKTVQSKVVKEKAVLKAAKANLQDQNDQLEELFPERKKKKK